MGLEFGNLPVRIRRILYYSLSPVEQRAWAKSMTHGIPNFANRAMRALPTVLPAIDLNCIFLFIGFIMSAVVYMWSTTLYDQSSRKDPKLYENDK